MKPEIDVSVLLNFASCAGLSNVVGEGGRQAVDFAIKVGGRFLTFMKDQSPAALVVDPTAADHLDGDGNLIVRLSYSHPLLARPLWEFEPFRAFDPAGNVGYIHEKRMVSLLQTGDANERKKFDALAHGQLAVANELYPLLLPKLGYIDVRGENTPADKVIRKTELRKLFWANFYAREYVQKFGRAFFLGAPGWRKEELCDGGILFVATESFHEWCKAPPVYVVEYFRTRIPAIKSYRAHVNWDA